jgi:GTP-binding protein SAR1
LFFSHFSFIILGLGLFQKNARIVFMGLDNAGKTTLLHMLTHDKLSVSEPTKHPGQEEFIIGNCKVKAFDLGGHESARRVWDDYHCAGDAVIYIIDCADRERFQEAKHELDKLLSIESMQNVPFLILGNKIDIQSACSEEELRHFMGLHHTSGKNKLDLGSLKAQGIRPMELFMCSIVRKTGYTDGFEWLMHFV